MFNHLHIVGLGLIGGSLAKAARAANPAASITASDPDQAALQQAREQGLLHLTLSETEGIGRADLIIFACPPSVFPAMLAKLSPMISDHAVLSDVLSVKQPVADAVSAYPFAPRFIPAHPIAGSAYSGFAASDATLFERRRVILTPAEDASEEAVKAVRSFWTALGAVPEAMHPRMHDLAYALVSHLPQILAYASAKILSAYDVPEQKRDTPFLRIAASDPALWRDICLANREHVGAGLATYLAVLRHVAAELTEGKAGVAFPDPAAVMALFPRIVASCLISTVATVEVQEGVTLARYAGRGFVDVTAPAATEPEPDIEIISKQFGALLEPLEKMTRYLEVIAEALEEEGEKLFTLFARARHAHAEWRSPRN